MHRLRQQKNCMQRQKAVCDLNHNRQIQNPLSENYSKKFFTPGSS